MKRTSVTVFIFFLFMSAASSALAQDVELIFSHKLHAQDVGAGCTDCHATAQTSSLPADNLLPSMQTCYTCHDEDTECIVCHKDPDNAIAYPRIATYISSFPHAKHVENNVECETCHAGVATSADIMDKHLPSMMQCQACHSDIEQVSYCFTCHAEGMDLRPVDHRMDWTMAHGTASHLESNDCKSCHSESQCLQCHQQDNLDRKAHPLNFVNSHPVFARANSDQCYPCHEEQAFCIDCHRQELIMPRNHSMAGWSNLKTGGRHAREAKMDLDNCLACHNQTSVEPVCAQCHQAK